MKLRRTTIVVLVHDYGCVFGKPSNAICNLAEAYVMRRPDMSPRIYLSSSKDSSSEDVSMFVNCGALVVVCFGIGNGLYACDDGGFRYLNIRVPHTRLLYSLSYVLVAMVYHLQSFCRRHPSFYSKYPLFFVFC